MATTPTLADEPAGPVRFYCPQCHRWAQYGRDRLVARYGPIVLPDLLRRVQPCDSPNDMNSRCRLAYWDRMTEENRAAARARCGMPEGW